MAEPMVMLSELLHFRVADAHGETTALTDLVISQLDTEYPLITHMIYRQKAEAILPWKNVKAIDWANRQINIKNYDQAQAADTFGQVVRLRRDVLDALVLDLQNRRAT